MVRDVEAVPLIEPSSSGSGAARQPSILPFVGEIVSFSGFGIFVFALLLAMRLEGVISWTYWAIFSPLFTVVVLLLLLNQSRKLISRSSCMSRIAYLICMLATLTFLVLLVIKLDDLYPITIRDVFVPLWILFGCSLIVGSSGILVGCFSCCIGSSNPMRKYDTDTKPSTIPPASRVSSRYGDTTDLSSDSEDSDYDDPVPVPSNPQQEPFSDLPSIGGEPISSLGDSSHSTSTARSHYLYEGVVLLAFFFAVFPAMLLIELKLEEGFRFSWGVAFIPLWVVDLFFLLTTIVMFIYTIGGEESAVLTMSQVVMLVCIVPCEVAFKVLLFLDLDRNGGIDAWMVFSPLMLTALLLLAWGLNLRFNRKTRAKRWVPQRVPAQYLIDDKHETPSRQYRTKCGNAPAIAHETTAQTNGKPRKPHSSSNSSSMRSITSGPEANSDLLESSPSDALMPV